MSDLNDLYQQMILDHGRKPRNFGVLQHADCSQEGYNPLCGDRLTVYLNLHDDVIEALTFKGVGCAISMASASLMTECLKGKSKAEAAQLFEHFHEVVMGKTALDEAVLGKLSILSGVSEFPMRVKCATLCWHTLMAALKGDQQQSVSTE